MGLDGRYVEIRPPFSIEFEIDRNPFSAVCKASFTIRNLGKATRNNLYMDLNDFSIGSTGNEGIKYRKIVFSAGYGTDTYEIFRGNMLWCYSERQGVDFLTKIEASGGQFDMSNSTVSTTIASGESRADMLVALMSSFNHVRKVVVGRKYTGKVVRGQALVGNTEEIIQQITRGDFFIDNDVAYAIADDEYYSTGIINSISSSSGLLGSPKREQGYLTIDMVFEPRFLMLQLVDLSSITVDIFNGQYRIVAIKHSGTISESVCGSAITTIRLQYGPSFVRTNKTVLTGK
jgi:hypothetical protein